MEGATAMSARDDILAQIRRSLGVPAADAPRRAAAAARLATRPRGVTPARGQGAHVEQVRLFTAMAQGALATCATVASMEQTPAEVARYLREANQPATVRMGRDPFLTALDWNATPLTVSHGPSDGSDVNSVSRAFAGVAETGTLVLISGTDNPTTLNFLPDNHIVVLRVDDIVGDYESVWDRLRDRFGEGPPPRTINLITGPSRSADIAQTILLGAHGPRKLHIVLVAGG